MKKIRIYYKLQKLSRVDKIVSVLLLCNKHEHTENSHTDQVHLKLFESQKKQLIFITTQRTDSILTQSTC